MDDDDELEQIVEGVFARWRRQLFEDELFLGLGIIIAYIAGIVYLGWFIFNQVRLEKSFHDRYGPAWREEYEKYYGSLTRAHMKIAVCLFALIAIGAISYWFYRQTSWGRSRHHHRQ